MGALELRWGLIIGAANLVWLYASYFLGMHTNGLAWIQVAGLSGVLISVVGYVLALRALVRERPEITYLEGLKSGVLVAGIVALIAVVAQVGYFVLINPDWTEYMVEETRRHYQGTGATREEIDSWAEDARTTFSLGSYATQAALGSLVVGIVSCAIIMAFVRRRLRR